VTSLKEWFHKLAGSRTSVLARLALVVLIPFSATSVTGFALFNPGQAARDVSAVPHAIAQALGLIPSQSTIAHSNKKTITTVPVHVPPSVPITPITPHVPVTPYVSPVPTNTPPPAPVQVHVASWKLEATTALGVGASNLTPGSSVSRGVDLDNVGTGTLGGLSFRLSASSQNPLVDNPSDGLQLTVYLCTDTWVEHGLPDGGATYTCPSGAQQVLSESVAQALQQTTTLSTPSTLAPHQTAHYVFTLSFPTAAGSAEEGQSASLTWSFFAEEA